MAVAVSQPSHPSIRQSKLIAQAQKYASFKSSLALPGFSAGVCEGLSLLWGYRCATHTRAEFTPRHRKMMSWDGDPNSLKEYQEYFESFIKEIDIMFFGKKSEGEGTNKEFHQRFQTLTNDKSPKVEATEFDISFMFHVEELYDLFNKILKQAKDKIIVIESVRLVLGPGISGNHSVGAFYSNNVLEYFDPNDDDGEQDISALAKKSSVALNILQDLQAGCAEDILNEAIAASTASAGNISNTLAPINILVKKIIQSMCFETKADTFPLRIRVLRLEGQKPGQYPSENAFVHRYILERRNQGLALELVENPFNENQRTNTLLHMAVAFKKPFLLRLLLNWDLPLDSSLPKFGTCLHLAIKMHEETLTLEILNQIDEIIKNAQEAKDSAEVQRLQSLLLETPDPISKKTPLQLSILTRKLIKSTRKLIRLGANPNVVDQSGKTPLYEAVLKGDPKTIGLLLEKKADPNLSKDNHHLPLYNAIKHGNEAIIDLLLEHGADLKLLIQQYPYILQVAVLKCSVKILKLLVQNGADVDEDHQGETPIVTASEVGNMPAIQFLISHRANVHIRGKNGRSALHYAKNKETAALLVKAGADLREVDSEGRSVLHYAQNAELVKYYLTKGASINLRTRNLRSPLHDIINIEAARSLIEAKANVEEGDSYRNSPLHFVGCKDIANMLLVKGANVNLPNNEGETPLHVVRNAKIAETFIKAKGNVQAVDKQGKTPLHQAQDVDIAIQLLEAGAKLNELDGEGRTPLQTAIIAHRVQVAQLLIERKADLTIADKKGNTALFYAVEKREHKLIETILQCGADINHLNKNGESVVYTAIATQNPSLLKLILAQHPKLNTVNKMGHSPLDYVKYICSYAILANPLNALLNAELALQAASNSESLTSSRKI